MNGRSNDDWRRGFGSEDARDTSAVYFTAQNGFNELADTYDARLAGNPLHLLESTEVLSALPNLFGLHVADIGCGTGRYALQMSRMGAASVVGIDLSLEMLAVAQRKGQRADLPILWQAGDIQGRLPVIEETLDVAVCAVVLSFLEQGETALREVARTLKPGGTLVVSDYHPHGLHQIRAESIALGRRDNAPYFRFTTANGEECRIPQYPYRVADLFATAQKVGLTLEHIAEPLCDRRLSNTYANLRDMVGVPLALVVRFRKK